MDATKSCARESQSGQSVLSDRIWMGLETAIGVAFDLIVAEPHFVIVQMGSGHEWHDVDRMH